MSLKSRNPPGCHTGPSTNLNSPATFSTFASASITACKSSANAAAAPRASAVVAARIFIPDQQSLPVARRQTFLRQLRNEGDELIGAIGGENVESAAMLLPKGF